MVTPVIGGWEPKYFEETTSASGTSGTIKTVTIPKGTFTTFAVCIIDLTVNPDQGSGDDAIGQAIIKVNGTEVTRVEAGISSEGTTEVHPKHRNTTVIPITSGFDSDITITIDANLVVGGSVTVSYHWLKAFGW